MYRQLMFVAGALLFGAGLFFLLPGPVAPQPDAWPDVGEEGFVLRGARLFDGERVQERMDVLVRDGLVEAVAPRLPVPAGVPVLGAEGHTLLPALIDAHTHNFGSSRAQALRFGVGTQLDMFTSSALLAPARAQRESREAVTEADMWSAGILVTAPGGHGTQYGQAIPTLDSAEDADAFVADRIAEGSDFIKLVLESGRGWGLPLPTLGQTVLRAVVAAARARDRLALAHVGNAEEAAMAVAAEVDGLVHLVGDAVLDDEVVARARERGIFVVPTLAVLESVAGRSSGLVDDPRLTPFLEPSQEEGLRRQFPGGEGRAEVIDRALANASRLFAGGVTLLAGSDAPNPGTAHGASLHRELELLVEAGLPPAAALAAATSAAADAFGLADRGRIAPGQRADLLLVRGDPTAEITATRDIVAIWKNGRRVERQRFDRGSEPAAEPLADGALGGFEADASGWLPTTDGIQGGASEVALSVAAGALVVEARVRPGAPWPWAGALRTLASQPWEPVDAASFEALELRLRGAGTVQVLFFSGVGAPSMPAMQPVALSGDWALARVPLGEVPGLDPRRLRAIAVVAAPAPGDQRFEISSVELR